MQLHLSRELTQDYAIHGQILVTSGICTSTSHILGSPMTNKLVSHRTPSSFPSFPSRAPARRNHHVNPKGTKQRPRQYTDATAQYQWSEVKLRVSMTCAVRHTIDTNGKVPLIFQ
ncbi:hypothetical protein E2C01_021348 [Portunus trituberculatus]|uniref:Uncharacterized protein n=1 Tax=Portunus trituberculatus TaxID=210409 RepID=A0A5B7E4F8_PORTR|nr:hypothetical protein [Portunus trituberculatus]